MIANAHTAGDGEWFWYAEMLRGGVHLYSTLHLALQPLFVLETELFLVLLGKGWIASKVPAILHLLALCLGIHLLSRRSGWPDWQKALLILGAFFLIVRFEAYRFDDYHVLCDSFALFMAVLLLRLEESFTAGQTLIIAAGLGLLQGLMVTTRLNDGAAMLIFLAIAIPCLTPKSKLASLATFFAVSALTALSIVLLTGDSLYAYAVNTIFKAPGSKGGLTSVMISPFILPWRSFLFLNPDVRVQVLVAALLAVLGVCAMAVRPLSWKNLVGVVAIAVSFQLGARQVFTGSIVPVLCAVWVFATYGLGLAAIIRLPKWSSSPREILLLMPLGLLASGSMSSAGSHTGLYAPIGILLLLIPLAFAENSRLAIKEGPARQALLAVIGLMALSGIIYRTNNPYSWHNYFVPRMFEDRVIFRHPEYGPMVIDKQLLNFIQPICREIDQRGGSRELLSLPYPYANYFCDIPPWHGYVQTFFDTSNRETIAGLMGELATPPQWILYQHQPLTLGMHESVYNQRRRLPHRDLDEFIMGKVASKEWAVVNRQDYGSDWILIRTRQ